jgi:glycosyltransferase involved in cell wall biosynthesis
LNVPVLATTVGDIPLLVRHGHSGYLAPPGDAQALASGMRALLDDPQRARRMADAALTILQEKFTAERMANDTQKLYGQLLEQRH